MNGTPQRNFPMDQHLRLLADAVHVGALVVREDLELELANEQACQLLGCADENELHARWAMLRDLIAKAIAHALEVREPTPHYDVEIPTAGDLRPMRVEVLALEDEAPRTYLLILRDRELLAAMETDLQLATRYRSMTRLYRSLAHDLKAPLNALTINLDLLKTTLGKNPPPDPVLNDRQQRYLKVLGDELTRLNRSLHSFIAQTIPPNETEQPFDLRDLVLDLISLIAPQGKQQQVAIEVQLAEQTMVVEGQRDLLKQALLNIAVNAFEAMPEGGRLHLKLEGRMGRAAITLQDSGPGITPEQLNHIWDMHYTTKKTGTGIGLYVARSVIESFGGTVAVEARPSHGACFTVQLPISSKEAK